MTELADRPRSETVQGQILPFAWLIAILYIFSPVDVIPDIFPIFGWLDDIGILSLVSIVQVMHILGMQMECGTICCMAAWSAVFVAVLGILTMIALIKYIVS